MERKQNTQHHEPSLEEEVQRVLRAGEQAKHAAEHEIDQQADHVAGATATARERIQDWADEGTDVSRAAVERVKDQMGHIGDEAANATERLDDTTDKATRRTRKGIYDAVDTLKEASHDATHMASVYANQIKDQAQDAAASVRSSSVGEATDAVRQRAHEASSQVAERTDAAINATGERIMGFADTVRANAPSGTAGAVATKAADALEQGGQYLHQHATSDILSDLTNLVRRRPIPSLFVALGLGYLAVRARRGSDRF